jgi:hypothetical protein
MDQGDGLRWLEFLVVELKMLSRIDIHLLYKD